jgi:NAD(P)-dependent dehydrogenase (short-subunit alcohol dehydrogenase family)
MQNRILISGASGLLGKALVRQFIEKDFFVFAQYHRNLPEEFAPPTTEITDIRDIRDLRDERDERDIHGPDDVSAKCQWIQADFSSLSGIRDFLVENSLRFKRCTCLVNNYGPITYKPVGDLTTDDFYSDFHHNVITAFEITRFFIKHTDVRVVVNVGFEGVGVVKPYKKILSYAAAKNALQLITQSFAAQYKNIRFHMAAPVTLEGAEVEAKTGNKVTPQSAAKEICETVIKSIKVT